MLRDPVCGMPLTEPKEEFKAEVRGKTYYFCGEYCKRSFLRGKKIAYFSMEIGLENNIPTYSGGLGVLAGDVIKSSADLKIPLVGVTLVSRKGYLKQELNDGKQIEHYDVWDPSGAMNELPNQVELQIQNRTVKVKAWMYDYQSPSGGLVSVLFLDTNVEGNSVEDREITSVLYGGDREYRLKQEIVLGVGGVKILDAAGFNIGKYHMNEGHSSFLTLQLLAENGKDIDNVRDLCIFTTHTPVEAGHDKFSYELVQNMLGDLVSLETLMKLGGDDQLNMTRLALNTSKYVNGVAKRHKEFSLTLFPGYNISAITNGVHSFSWTCKCFRVLLDKYLPGWANEPELLVRIDSIPDEEVWRAHMEAKENLIRYVREKSGVQLAGDVLTLGFARRFTGYKRATLLFSNLKRLEEINKKGKIQVVFAGKAHPKDWMGKRLIEEINELQEKLRDTMKIVYLENYGLEMASLYTSGVDVWLNTPIPPFEASGTSGMKAAHNGVINFSVLDGWWIEGCIEGVTGWAIGPSPKEEMEDAERRRLEITQLYDKLDYLIIPTFYKNRDDWIKLMKNSIGKVAYYFNSHRMMRRYASEAYL
ncbi:MAG: alpha-glucan family phosphorylase [Candidatus Bathyarchaeota archaeon]|nr:alpha-glucan family phosphorylase [Candidatus Bathyarchaeum tardum]WNZ29025.1 MAG: alpha-glucan family phosphorylase [Candidatus Bathyarchaeota archaeon]